MRTVPVVPRLHSDVPRSLQCATSANPLVQPNPLKPRYGRSLEGLTLGDDRPNPIHLCVTCRSKDLSRETHLFWLWRRWCFVCNECGTALQQVGDKYKLVRVVDSESAIWRKYAGKILYSREWANIANGGLSDEEIVVSWSGPPVAHTGEGFD
jgi:hypothetical protein